MTQYAALDDVIYLWFASNDTSGSGGDGASPAADVRLAGAAADAAPVYSPTPALLTHANYPAGSYEIAITASAANGFATGNTYAVFCTLAIDAQNPTGFVGSFDLKPVDSNMEQCGGSAVAAGAIPNAAADAAGGLPISDAGGLDLDTKLANTNEITVARMGALTDWINGGRLDNLLDAIPTTAMRGTDSATLAATWTDARAGYLDNLSAGAVALATGVDLTSIHGAALTETVNGYLAAAFVKLFDVATPLLVASEVMRGTDGANTTVPDAAGIAATPAEVATALSDIHLDHLLAADYDPASKPGVATALLNELVENDGGVSRYTANALEQAPSGGTNPNVLIDTTISGAPSSQTVFVLTAGSDIDDAYKDQAIVLYDASNNDYPSVRKVSDYTGATKTVTLDSAPDFTIIAGDGVKTFVTAPGTTAPTVGQIRAEMEGVGYFLDLIKADTDELQTDDVPGKLLSYVQLLARSDAAIATDNATELTAINADGGSGVGDFSNQTDGQEAIRDIGDSAWITATGFSTHSAANVWAVGTRALTDKSGFALSATGANLILKDSTFALAIADAIWDEILSGVTHNIASSAGRRLREIGAYAIDSGTAQAGGSNSITLAATASAIDGTYNRNLIVLTDNTGVGQTRTIVDYDGATKIAVIDRDWRTSPDATTTYQVTPDNTPLVVDQGIAQAGSATTITLRAYASAVNDTYLCNVVAIIAGTGRGQARLVGGYVGATKVVTICGDNWVTNPDNTSVYVLMPYGTTCTSCIGTYARGQINTECDTALTDYDPPTRAEATTDKAAIITKVGANETKIDIVDGNVDAILVDTDTTIPGLIAALNDISVANIIAGITDGALDLQEMMRIIVAFCACKSSGGGTATIKFRDYGDAKDRITATVDITGNRTAVTLDGS